MSLTDPNPTVLASQTYRSSDSELPPSYYEDFHETTGGFIRQTTTTVTTTTTTTSFFPHIRGRNKVSTSETNAKMSDRVASDVQDLPPEATSASLLINKELPALPERTGKTTNSQMRRPRTAEGIQQTERRESAVGVSMPLALAHASMGLKIPSITPISPGWTAQLMNPDDDPVERQSMMATPRPRKRTSSLKRSKSQIKENTFPAFDLSPPSSATTAPPSAPLPSSRNPYTSAWVGSPEAGSSWNSSPSPASPAIYNEPSQLSGAQTDVELANGKKVTRRASWWGRRKRSEGLVLAPGLKKPDKPAFPISPPSNAQDLIGQPIMRPPQRATSSSSITPKRNAASLGDLMRSPSVPVIDLSTSPPPSEHTMSPSALNPEVSQYRDNVSSDSHSSLTHEDEPLTTSRVPVRTSSRRPRALSLFLKSPTADTPEALSPSRSPFAPSPGQAHPRLRSGPSTPILRRFSSSLFSASPYSSISPTPNSSHSIAGVLSTESRITLPSQPVPQPKIDEESPEDYVQRLLEAVSKAEVAGVLASSGDAFHAEALKIYLERFAFKDDPLDIAIRRLLMHLSLPRETQQIDRVMEAFASRYNHCNPDLFVESDQAYILAFSLIMLHTDAFNKSNKNKMTKAGYIKNTRLPGVQPEILDYFFDNITFAPFIFIEDPMDVNGQRGFSVDSASSTASTFLSKSNKIDPYYLITRDLLHPFRLDVSSIPFQSPYNFLGTAASWDHEELRKAFAEASVVQLGDRDARRQTITDLAFSGFTSTAPSVIPMTLSTHGGMAPAAFSDVWTFKLTKIGLINRKEDVIEGGKRAVARKWKQFKVALTGSQLLFFRDLRWDHHLFEKPGKGRPLTLPNANAVRPDEVLSLQDAVAVLDHSYTKYRNVFRLVLPKGRQYLLQVLDEHELNEWIARINYASAFKTAGIRMRTTGLSGREVELTGIAAANSHAREILQRQRTEATVDSPDHLQVKDQQEDLSQEGEEEASSSSPSISPSLARRDRLIPVSRSSVALDVESADGVFHEDAEKMKAAFEDVKAELAAKSNPLSESSHESAGKRESIRLVRSSSAEKLTTSQESSFPAIDAPHERLSSRGNVIRLKVAELEKKVVTLQGQLDSDLRTAKNLAVLTPFQQTTRVRLQAHVPPLSRRINQLRLDLVKLICHKDVLHADFVADERQRYQTTRAALKVATATLRSRLADSSLSKKESKSDIKSSPHPLSNMPKERVGSFASSSSSTQEGSDAHLSMRVQSITSAPDEQSVQPMEGPSPIRAMSPTTDAEEIYALDEPSRGFEDSSERQSISKERAEDWNKTRAAKRVSLVTVPADVLKGLANRPNLDGVLGQLREEKTSGET
ncbi:hypothetical protein CPB86DRAFT_721318 [Serendipita vermifera]|nr:hypothetical protein CPB86DRAFT_721318 [Serendipita vermifera]